MTKQLEAHGWTARASVLAVGPWATSQVAKPLVKPNSNGDVSDSGKIRHINHHLCLIALIAKSWFSSSIDGQFLVASCVKQPEAIAPDPSDPSGVSPRLSNPQVMAAMAVTIINLMGSIHWILDLASCRHARFCQQIWAENRCTNKMDGVNHGKPWKTQPQWMIQGVAPLLEQDISGETLP